MQKMPLATEKSIEIEKMNLALASFRRALATEAFFPTFSVAHVGIRRLSEGAYVFLHDADFEA